MDATSSAGVNVLRGVGQNGPTVTVSYAATDLPMPIPPSTATDTTRASPSRARSPRASPCPTASSSRGTQTAAGQSVMQVQLNLTFANDPDLTATLYHYDPSGDLLGQVVLFSGVGQGTNTANFTNTVFDDNAATPIQHGSAPFSAIYDPQESLATVFAPTAAASRA